MEIAADPKHLGAEILQRPAYLESEAPTSSACSLCGRRGRFVSESRPVETPSPRALLSPRRRSQRGLPRQISRGAPRSLYFRRTGLSWSHSRTDSAQALSELGPSTL